MYVETYVNKNGHLRKDIVFCTARELSKILHVSTGTIYRWRKYYNMPSVMYPDRKYEFDIFKTYDWLTDFSKVENRRYRVSYRMSLFRFIEVIIRPYGFHNERYIDKEAFYKRWEKHVND